LLALHVTILPSLRHGAPVSLALISELHLLQNHPKNVDNICSRAIVRDTNLGLVVQLLLSCPSVMEFFILDLSQLRRDAVVYEKGDSFKQRVATELLASSASVLLGKVNEGLASPLDRGNLGDNIVVLVWNSPH